MKKDRNMKRIVVPAILALALVSCTNKELEPVRENEKPEPVISDGSACIKAVLSEELATRTAFEGGSTTKVVWVDGDAINVNGVNSSDISIDGSDASQASFTVFGVSSPYVALYPAAVYTSDYTAAVGDVPATMTITLPSTQNYMDGCFAPESAVLMGKGGSSISFTHAMAYIKIIVSGGSTGTDIKKIRLLAGDGTPLSGTFTASFGDVPSIGSGTDTYSSVTLDCGAGVSQGTPMYIAVPPGAYASGINILIIDTDGKYQVQNSFASFTAVAGKVYPTDISYTSQGTYVESGIYSAADWESFVADATAGDYSSWQDGSGKVNLMADIYFATQPTFLTASFDGTMEGNGYTVTAKARTHPLLAEIAKGGIVRNITCKGIFTALDDGAETGTAAIAKYNYGTVSHCYNRCTMETFNRGTAGTGIAGIVGKNAGLIEYCDNYMDISYTFTGMTVCYGGGISMNSGQKGSGTFFHCTNYGNITVTHSSASNFALQRLALGGIVGTVTAGTSSDYSLFDHCVNKGTIKVYENTHHASTAYAYTLGGIVGRVSDGDNMHLNGSGNYYAKFNECSNSGTIDASSCAPVPFPGASGALTGVRVTYVAGIVGAAKGLSTDYVDIINCTNTGTLRSGGAQRKSDSKSYTNSCAAGIVGYAYYVNVSGGSATTTYKVAENPLATVDKMGVLAGAIGWARTNCTISDFTATMTLDIGGISPDKGSGFIGAIASDATVTASGSCSVSGAGSIGTYDGGTLSGTVSVL